MTEKQKYAVPTAETVALASESILFDSPGQDKDNETNVSSLLDELLKEN